MQRVTAGATAARLDYDVVILGAGAAGMLCAMFAGATGARVALLDHADRPGKKILISGGGRCNFTNLHTRPENFLSQNPHFAKSALARYTPQDFVALVEKHGIAYHEKTLGQLFCDGSARQIVQMLETECRASGVHLLLNTCVEAVTHGGGNFTVETVSRGAATVLRAPSLVVATGGLSIPKMGATALGYEIARQFGLNIVETRPALVPLLFSHADAEKFADLAGISTDASIRIGTTAFREKLLFTHRGLSGPAVLQASSYWRPGSALHIDLAHATDVTAKMRAKPAGRDATALEQALRKVFSQRLAGRWVDLNLPADGTNRSLLAFEQTLHEWHMSPGGTEGYEKAEVTAGGVDTEELSAKTMEARRLSGLTSSAKSLT